MKRPLAWPRRLFLAGLLVIASQYVTSLWLVPRALRRAVARHGGTLVIGRAQVAFPFGTTLTSLRLAENTAVTALSVQRISLRPQGLSLPSRTISLGAVEIEKPLLRLSRTKAGTLLWPGPASSLLRRGSAPGPRAPSWRFRIESLTIRDGILEFVDEQPQEPFHGVVQHLSLVVGPVMIPLGGPPGPGGAPPGPPLSFAGRGVVVGDDGHSAPIYCSGWLDPAGRDLQASGRLEPFALAAFGPYYRGPPEVRVHAATLSSTSQWSARANELTARVRLELGNLGEDDLTVRGRTVLDVQTVAGEGKPSSLSGEITLSGPLDDHTAWQGTFLPGDAGIQHLVARLQSRGVESIRLPLLPEPIFVSLRPASASVMTDIAAAAKEVREALEILATPLPEELPAHAQEPPAEPSPGPGETPAPSGATLAPAAESAPIAPLDAASSSPAPAAGPLRAIAPDVPARAP